MGAPKPKPKQHTPGPWQVQDERFPVNGYTVLGPYTDVDAEPGDMWPVATGLKEADAHMVAAAPDLADELERMVLHHAETCRNMTCSFGFRARDALRKARVIPWP